MTVRAAARPEHSPWLRGAALAAALALHAAVLLALLWRAEPGLPPPPPLYGVPLVFAGVAGPDEQGAGAAPPPTAPGPAEPAPPPDIPSPEPASSEPAPPAPAAGPSLPQAAPPDAPAPVAPPPPRPQALPLPPPPAPAAPPPPPEAAPGPIRLGAGLALAEAPPGPDRSAARPREIGCNDATEYPAALSQAGIGGDVLLRLRLTDKGRVIEARVVQSSGHAELDAAAQRGVRRCRFEPAVRDGVPVWSSRDWRTTFRPTAG
ncbi:energy transducer TonB [Roseomonas haemaphysalidis]|uniref:Energy transducer TonB n=1 Tax=Roseomonas haemaphysalidis TaxID=2768162 RepID=A0ABS3KR39_9PROT|nr:energy transducer TonB [Roseomonas haemaphysalidis]MBO1079930.1 energy transducer TonB [Roseomonas haemaphysalidis]